MGKKPTTTMYKLARLLTKLLAHIQRRNAQKNAAQVRHQNLAKTLHT